MDIDAIILAAGESRRLGRAKQLLPFGGLPLILRARRAVEQARPRRIVVVLGAHADDIRAVITGRSWACELVENRAWAGGMGSSIVAGMRTISAPQAPSPPAGVLLMTCDQPLIPAGHFARLRAAFAAAPNHVAASRYGGGPGVPAVFPAALFDELQTLPPDAGAKRLIVRHPQVLQIPCAEASFDIDTESDYRRLLAATGHATAAALP
jgi:molybdenum cofactor cytidylyltransferase